MTFATPAAATLAARHHDVLKVSAIDFKFT
jgi:hypothetical protein